MYRICLIIILTFFFSDSSAQLKWVNVDAEYGALPSGFHIFKTTDSLDGKPFVAYYAIADLKNKKLKFTADTTYKRRFTPQQFYEKNKQPLLVVNSTFFSFATNQNLNAVIIDGKTIGFNHHSIALKGKDTFQFVHPLASAFGITKKRKADIAWVFGDSSRQNSYALQNPVPALKDSVKAISYEEARQKFPGLKQWKMQTAVGGGPVLVQEGRNKITNNEEFKFAGKAINDKHPRTLMGYTADGKVIVMVIQGRMPGLADGADLLQAARLMIGLGCLEALNLDGGGSSCMLINGKETIKPSDKEQRAVPAVFIIRHDSR